jgi:hypothetical protein
MNGDDVRTLQGRLLSLNFHETGDVDGWYGPLTKSAVEKFQRFAGIAHDGIVTQETWDALFLPDKILTGFLTDMSVIIGYDLKHIHKYDEALSVPEASGRVTWYVDRQNLKSAKIGISEASKSKEYEAFKVDKRYIILETVHDTSDLATSSKDASSEATYYHVGNKTYVLQDGKAEISQKGLDSVVLTTLEWIPGHTINY